MALPVGCDDKIIFLPHNSLQIVHHQRGAVLPAVVVDEARPKGPLFFFVGPPGHHALQNTAQSVLPFEISKQFFKGRIVRKEMQSLGDGQTVAGADQDSVRLFDSFCNKVPVSYVRSLLPILCLNEIAPVG